MGEHAFEFHVRHRSFERIEVSADALERCIVLLAAGDSKEFLRIAQVSTEPFQGADNGFQRLAFSAKILGALAVAPDRRVFDELYDFGQSLVLGLKVKDTSADLQRDLPRSAVAWRWR